MAYFRIVCRRIEVDSGHFVAVAVAIPHPKLPITATVSRTRICTSGEESTRACEEMKRDLATYIRARGDSIVEGPT